MKRCQFLPSLDLSVPNLHQGIEQRPDGASKGAGSRRVRVGGRKGSVCVDRVTRAAGHSPGGYRRNVVPAAIAICCRVPADGDDDMVQSAPYVPQLG